MPIRKKKSRTKLKIRRKNSQDKKLCLTKGQLLNVVIASEVIGYNDAKKKRKQLQKCCPKAKRFVKELKAEIHEKDNKIIRR